MDHLQDVLGIAEPGVCRLQFAVSLDVDLTRAVDQDVADRGVAEEFLDGPQTEDLINDVPENLRLLSGGE